MQIENLIWAATDTQRPLLESHIELLKYHFEPHHCGSVLRYGMAYGNGHISAERLIEVGQVLCAFGFPCSVLQAVCRTYICQIMLMIAMVSAQLYLDTRSHVFPYIRVCKECIKKDRRFHDAGSFGTRVGNCCVSTMGKLN